METDLHKWARLDLILRAGKEPNEGIKEKA